MDLSIKNGYYGTTDAVQLTDRWKVLTQYVCSFLTGLKVFPTSQNQNFVLFPNMDLEILCRVSFESSELIFNRPKNLFRGESFSTQFCIFIFVIRNCKLERLLLHQLVEQNVLFDFFPSFDKTSEFSFFLNLDF